MRRVDIQISVDIKYFGLSDITSVRSIIVIVTRVLFCKFCILLTHSAGLSLFMSLDLLCIDFSILFPCTFVGS